MNRKVIAETWSRCRRVISAIAGEIFAAMKQLIKSRVAWRAPLPAERYAKLFEEAAEPQQSSGLNAEKRGGTPVCAARFFTVVFFQTKVRQRNRLAQFLAGATGCDRPQNGFQADSAAQRIPLCVLLRTSEARVKNGPPPTTLRYCDNGLALQSVAEGTPSPGLRMNALHKLILACCSAMFASLLFAADMHAPQNATAIFAGGCFWCMEADFEKLDGVIAVESGYTGGSVNKPTYEQVSEGSSGHAEAVRVVYDPQRASYEKLLGYFWRNIDPTVKDRQFCDIGAQYRSAIFYQNDTEQRLALSSKLALEKSGRFQHIYTEIVAAGTFYPAEDHHQDYYKKNPIRYKFYRTNCGRDARLKSLWGQTQ